MKYALKKRSFFYLLLIAALGSFLCAHVAFAQNWQALPPYNTLWPLWSPALSPADPVTGVPTPLVSNLAVDTTLPLMPGLTWDPAIAYPWLLYNSPAGMVYFDPLFGIDSWPPKGFVHGTTPVPIALPPGYSALAPTPSATLKNLVPLANLSYISAFPTLTPPFGPAGTAVIPPTLTSLLTAATIIGTGAPMVVAPTVPPTPVVPLGPPTAAVPTPVVPPIPPTPAIPIPVVPPIAATSVAPPPTLIAPVPTAAVSALTSLLSFTTFGGSSTVSTTTVAPVITNWSGLWFSLLSTSQLGPMNLSLSQNTVTGAVTGTASLVLNKLVPLPVTVSGTFLGGTAFTVSGIFTDYQLAISGLFLIPIDYTLTLNCTITSATTMSGTYTITSIKENDVGNFNLNLL
ncbi:MAG: hypothetical protein ACMUIP_12400 [bacterium]